MADDNNNTPNSDSNNNTEQQADNNNNNNEEDVDVHTNSNVSDSNADSTVTTPTPPSPSASPSPPAAAPTTAAAAAAAAEAEPKATTPPTTAESSKEEASKEEAPLTKTNATKTTTKTPHPSSSNNVSVGSGQSTATQKVRNSNTNNDKKKEQQPPPPPPPPKKGQQTNTTKTAAEKEQTTTSIDQDQLLVYSKQIDALLRDYMGILVDEKKTFYQLGIDSAQSLELTNLVASRLGVTLPYDAIMDETKGVCATPSKFRSYIQNRMAHDQVTAPTFASRGGIRKMHSRNKLSWTTLGILQAIGSVLIIVLSTTSFIPVWYLWDYLQQYQLYCFILPLHIVSSTTVLIITKWLLICRYRPQQISVPSTVYLRWWMVDRLVAIWEIWAGRFLLDTPWLSWVYVLLGANVKLSSNFRGFIREFDLITVEKHATLDYPCTQARSFVSWDDMDIGPTMIFKPIKIGKKSVVRGMVSPGAVIGKRVVVEPLTVVPEDATIEDKQGVIGNPGILTSPGKVNYYGWGLAGMLKTTWLFLDLFAFYYLAWLAIFINIQWLGVTDSWGIGDIVDQATNTAAAAAGASATGKGFITLRAFVSFAFIFSFLMMLSSVLVKILLIGCRSQGRAREYLWQYFVDWAVDYHYSISIIGFQVVARNSRLANLFLMLHGMPIDFASKVDMHCFRPSQMDLIRVRKSFITNCTFDVKHNGQFRRISIKDSSIGSGSHIMPDTFIVRAVVAPLSFVRGDVVTPPWKWVHKNDLVNSCGLYFWEVTHLVLYIVFVAIFYIVLIPPFEYWMMFASKLPGYLEWLVLTGCLFLLSCSWGFVLIFGQHIALCGASEARPRPWSVTFYTQIVSFGETFQEWDICWQAIHGSTLFQIVLQLLGAHINGRAVIMPKKVFDCPMLIFEDRTVIDGCTVTGSNKLYNNVQIGPSYASGLVIGGSLVMAHGYALNKRTGPLRAKVLNFRSLENYEAEMMRKGKDNPATCMV